MTVALLIITHNQIGQELITTVNAILGGNTPPIESISIPAGLDPADLGKFADQIRDTIVELSAAQSVLILTDIYGATPNNLARYFASDLDAVVLSGVNLPMLLRVLNYREQDIDQLVTTAIEGAKMGIVRD
jgi:PTS system ascorbate-specific IIA component